MTAPTRSTNLRNILAELYPDEADQRRLLADAGIDATRVALNSSAINNWHAILSQAEKTNKLASLLAVAQTEYGANANLRAAVTAYRHGAEQTQRTLSPLGKQRLTWRQISLGTAVTVLLAAIGLWADVLSIGSWLRPTPTALATLTPTPTISPTAQAAQPFTYGVTVRDANGQPLTNASVRIEVANKAPLDEYTDSNGFARLVIPAQLAEQPGRLTVTADGYAVTMLNIDLTPNQLPQEIRLQK